MWLQHGAAEGPTEETTEKEAESAAGPLGAKLARLLGLDCSLGRAGDTGAIRKIQCCLASYDPEVFPSFELPGYFFRFGGLSCIGNSLWRLI